MDIRGFEIGSIGVLSTILLVRDDKLRSMMLLDQSIEEVFFEKFSHEAAEMLKVPVYGPDSIGVTALGSFVSAEDDGHTMHKFRLRALVGKKNPNNWMFNTPVAPPGSDQFKLQMLYPDTLEYFTMTPEVYSKLMSAWIGAAFEAGEVPVDARMIRISEIPTDDLSKGVPVMVVGPVARKELVGWLNNAHHGRQLL